MASLFSSNFMLLSDLQVFHLAKEKDTWQRTQALWQSFASSVSSLSSYWWLLLSNALIHLEPSLRGLKMCLWYENLCHLADVISPWNHHWQLLANLSFSINLTRVFFAHSNTFNLVETWVILLQSTCYAAEIQLRVHTCVYMH